MEPTKILTFEPNPTLTLNLSSRFRANPNPPTNSSVSLSLSTPRAARTPRTAHHVQRTACELSI